jgi:carboxypeptidase PM20D1
LETIFPRVHRTLKREVVGTAGALLYTWPGTDASTRPWLLSSHQDVVPVEAGTEMSWNHPPFGGDVADGYVWGRGALDVKAMLLAALESAEHLLASGFKPRRTIYFAFGTDEELEGERGAGEIAKALGSQGVRLAFTLDEGGFILSGAIPGITPPVALVGTAEKGDVQLRLRAEDVGGHSSMPDATAPPARLARAIVALADHPMPAGLSRPTTDAFAFIAPHARQPPRFIYHHWRLFAPLLLSFLRRDPVTDAALRTTMSATMIACGVAGNAIPRMATAIVNARLKPGDSVPALLEHVRRLAVPCGVEIDVVNAWEASRISDANDPAFRAICSSIREVMPDVVATPVLTLNSTDSRHYAGLADNQYRFAPIRMLPADLKRIHGTDERISVESYVDAVEFFIRYIRNVDRL